MSLRMLYLIFSRLCGWMLLLTDSATFLHGWYLPEMLRLSASKDVELLVFAPRGCCSAENRREAPPGLGRYVVSWRDRADQFLVGGARKLGEWAV
jgi:hypothetical protein